MVDAIPFGTPIIGDEEKAAVLEVLSQPVLVHGPRATLFEERFREYTGVAHATSVSSCTAGLHLIYFHLGLGPGDEVIVPAQTHNATAHAVELVGARPVFVDAEAETGNIDLDRLEAAITPRTRAISVVHYLGVPVDMDRVNAIAAKHGLVTVEDCALAMGTRLHGVHAGGLGDFAAFSFYPVKHMTTAEGGMITTKRAADYEAFKRKKAFGVDRNVGERAVPGVYDVTMLGFNYRMSELHAALGTVQLTRMQGFLAARARNYARLARHLRELPEVSVLGVEREGFTSSWYCLSMLLSERLAAKRFEIISALKHRGIGTSVYYPHPVPYLTYYREKYGFRADEFPIAARLSYSSVALPVGPHLGDEEMDRIGKAVREAIAEVG